MSTEFLLPPDSVLRHNAVAMRLITKKDEDRIKRLETLLHATILALSGREEIAAKDLKDLADGKTPPDRLEEILVNNLVSSLSVSNNQEHFAKQFQELIKTHEANLAQGISGLMTTQQKTMESFSEMVDGFRRSQDDSARSLGSSLKEQTEILSQFLGFQKSLNHLEAELQEATRARNELQVAHDELSASLHQLQLETHSYLMALSSGISLHDIPLPRFLSLEVYTDSSDSETIAQLRSAATDLMEELDLSIAHEFSPEYGSFLQRFWARSRDWMTQDEVSTKAKEITTKAQHAAEIRSIDIIQADIDMKKADAISKLAGAFGESSGAIKCGSILVVKIVNPDKTSFIEAIDLSTEMMILLANKPDLIKNPTDLLFSIRNQMPSVDSPLRLE